MDKKEEEKQRPLADHSTKNRIERVVLYARSTLATTWLKEESRDKVNCKDFLITCGVLLGGILILKRARRPPFLYEDPFLTRSYWSMKKKQVILDKELIVWRKPNSDLIKVISNKDLIVWRKPNSDLIKVISNKYLTVWRKPDTDHIKVMLLYSSEILKSYARLFGRRLQHIEAKAYVENFILRDKQITGTAADVPHLIFTDAAFNENLSKKENASYGIVRMSWGKIVGKQADSFGADTSVVAEAKSLRMAVRLALTLGYPTVVICDCQPVLIMVGSPEDLKNETELTSVINDIRKILSLTDKIVLAWTYSSNNTIADLLANGALKKRGIQSRSRIINPTPQLTKNIQNFNLLKYMFDPADENFIPPPGSDTYHGCTFRKARLAELYHREAQVHLYAVSRPTYEEKAKVLIKIINDGNAKCVVVYVKSLDKLSEVVNHLEKLGNIEAFIIHSKSKPEIMDDNLSQFGKRFRVLVTNEFPSKSFTVDEHADLIVYMDVPLDFPGDRYMHIQCVGETYKQRSVIVICEELRESDFKQSMEEIGIAVKRLVLK